MRELYSKKLTELKPYLGSKWMARIARELGISDKMKVHYAFVGKLADEGLVIKIYQKAAEIAKSNIEHTKRLNAEHEQIISEAQAVS